MTDWSVTVKKIVHEGDFTWPLSRAIDPDQLVALKNAPATIPVPQYCSDWGNGEHDAAEVESTTF
jgi:hypothetical protein